MSLRLIVGIACVSALVLLRIPPAHGTTYVARDLLDSGLPIPGEARAINGLGQVVGYRYSPGAQGNPQMFVWDPDAGARAIAVEGPNPCDINDVGQVAGFSAGSWEVARAFVWAADAGMVLLGEPNSGAFAINEAGLVVGFAAPPGQTYHAALWSSGSMLDLGTLGGLYSQAHDINDAGQIVGWATNSNGQQRACLWSTGGAATDLGTLGGSSSAATGIDSFGRVVGVSDIDGEYGALFFWSPDQGMSTLLTFSWVGDMPYPHALNDEGVVVGSIQDQQGSEEAFVWDAVTGLTVLGSGAAYDINGAGQIVGRLYRDGEYHAVVWEPVPEPSSLVSLALGLVSLAAAIRKRRSA